MCGENSKRVHLLSHTNRHTTYKDADRPLPETDERVSVLSFSIQIATKRTMRLSFNESKALAFHSLVRAYEQKNNKRCSYTVNSLHNLTNVHAKTIEKRLVTLERMGLVDYDENNKIILKRAKAKHKEHNTIVTIRLDATALKNAETYFMSARVVNKLKQINHFRGVQNQYHKIMSSKHGGTLKEIKSMRRWLSEHCKNGCSDKKFVDYGWSYKSIASYLGVSITKAVEIIKFAAKNNIITKKTNYMFVKLSHSSQLEYIQHTYASHGYAYKVWANSYAIPTGTI